VSHAKHVAEAYGGKTVCVDAYVWLHRGAYACARELCEGVPTRKHVEYFMNRARMLARGKIRAIYVFDGGRLPSKSGEEESRRRGRSEALARAKQHAMQGNASAAYEQYTRAVDVTPEMARQVIDALAKEGFESLTAPYEADAQMAYLAKHGFVDGVITEDSDLIAHGCASVFTKMGADGHGIEIRYGDLARNRDLSFVGFTPEMFLEMCVLSGCDYLPSLNGVGIKKAHGLIRRFKTYTKVLRHMKFEGISVPRDYEARFEDALLTFKFQWVYCPKRQHNVNLNDPTGVLDESAIADLPRLIGAYHAPTVAHALANSAVHPMTLETFGKAVAVKNRSQLKAFAPKSHESLFSDDAIERAAYHVSTALAPSPSRTSTRVRKADAAFASFLQDKPEDNINTLRAALTRNQPRAKLADKALGARAPGAGKSFYAALKSRDAMATPSTVSDIRDADVGAETEGCMVVPDSMEKATPRRARTPVSTIAETRVIAETPIASKSVKKSPYFKSPPPATRSNSKRSDATPFATIARTSMESVKKSVDAEFSEFMKDLPERPARTPPTRTTPARAAKKSKSRGASALKDRNKDDKKFWQSSLFDTFAFGK